MSRYLFFFSGIFQAQCKNGPSKKQKDASPLLTVEAFLLTVRLGRLLLAVRLSYLWWGNRKQKRPNPISGQGEP